MSTIEEAREQAREALANHAVNIMETDYWCDVVLAPALRALLDATEPSTVAVKTEFRVLDAPKDCDYHEGFEEGIKVGRAGSGPRPITDEMVDAATQALGVHRWKTMGVNTVECECGEIIGLPDAERTGDLIEDSILQAFPADLAFRKHLARVALEAAEGARR